MGAGTCHESKVFQEIYLGRIEFDDTEFPFEQHADECQINRSEIQFCVSENPLVRKTPTKMTLNCVFSRIWELTHRAANVHV